MLVIATWWLCRHVWSIWSSSNVIPVNRWRRTQTSLITWEHYDPASNNHTDWRCACLISTGCVILLCKKINNINKINHFSEGGVSKKHQFWSLSCFQHHIAFCPQSKNAVYANINIVDTSIKRQISDQSTTVVKGCMYIMFDMADTAFSYFRALIVC